MVNRKCPDEVNGWVTRRIVIALFLACFRPGESNGSIKYLTQSMCCIEILQRRVGIIFTVYCTFCSAVTTPQKEDTITFLLQYYKQSI